MPVILRSDEFGLWRDRQIYEAEKLKSLFAPYPTERLEAYQVSTLWRDSRITAHNRAGRQIICRIHPSHQD
jgi:putative SOS response-associated peptidase YedK